MISCRSLSEISLVDPLPGGAGDEYVKDLSFFVFSWGGFDDCLVGPIGKCEPVTAEEAAPTSGSAEETE